MGSWHIYLYRHVLNSLTYRISGAIIQKMKSYLIFHCLEIKSQVIFFFTLLTKCSILVQCLITSIFSNCLQSDNTIMFVLRKLEARARKITLCLFTYQAQSNFLLTIAFTKLHKRSSQEDKHPCLVAIFIHSSSCPCEQGKSRQANSQKSCPRTTKT